MFVLFVVFVENVKYVQARSKLPKKRRRALMGEQPRRKREPTVTNRRTNALKHQHTHLGAQSQPSVLKDSFCSTKSGHVNGVNVIGCQSSASPSNQPMSMSMSHKMANITGGNTNIPNKSSPNQTGSQTIFQLILSDHMLYIFSID